MARLGPKKAGAAVAAGMAAAGVSGWLFFAAPKVAVWEGFYTHTYKDIVGVPTYCLGETEDARMGRVYTEDYCVELLLKKLPRYNREINRCIGDLSISDKM